MIIFNKLYRKLCLNGLYITIDPEMVELVHGTAKATSPKVQSIGSCS